MEQQQRQDYASLEDLQRWAGDIMERPHDLRIGDRTETFRRVAGDIVTRKATDFHRLELVDNEPCISRFFTGPVVREWGFMCPQGWRHHNDFNDPNDIGQVSKGCGE